MNAGNTMNCPECGNPIAVTDQFCPKCFARLEPPGLWRKLLSLFRSAGQSRPARPTISIQKTVTIKTVGEDGQPHEYHSLDEVPPGLRAEIEKLESDVMKEKGKPLSFTETSPAGDATTSEIISQKSISIYKVRDASGQERVYHSLAELPPDIRAQIEKLEPEALNERLDSPPSDAPALLSVVKKNVSIFKVKDAQGNERTYHSLDEMPPDIRSLVERAQK